MYLFKEFNRKHAGQVRASIILYLVTILVAWFSSFFSFTNTNAALTATVFIFLAVHVVRIAYLTRVYDLALTKMQYFAAGCMAFGVALFVIFAYSQVPANETAEAMGISHSILLSLFLAAFLSVYVDFGIASFLTRLNT
jgi:hypothetical protein